MIFDFIGLISKGKNRQVWEQKYAVFFLGISPSRRGSEFPRELE